MKRKMRLALVVPVFALVLCTIYFLFLHGKGQSEILIADRMSEFVDLVDRHKGKNKLIVLDLDDTVFVSSQLIGTPTWFYNMINLLRQGGAAEYEAYGVVQAIDKIIQEQVEVVPIEQATFSAIRNWQKQSITVVGITTRPVEAASLTKLHLDQVGLSFSSSYFSCVEKSFEKRIGSFADGVLYANDNQKKAKVFYQFFKKIRRCGLDVDLIAYADDQQRYVKKVAKYAKAQNVDILGIIYGGALASRVFDFATAKQQLIGLELSLGVPIVPRGYRQVLLGEDP